MYNYLTKFNDDIFYISGKNLYRRAGLLLQHECDIVYIKEDWIIDITKKVYKINFIEKKLIFISILSKGISDLQIMTETQILVSDRFGDIYHVKNGLKLLLFGNSCYTTSLIHFGHFIFTADKYGRIRVSELSGKIIQYIFTKISPITSMVLINNKIICATASSILIAIDPISLISISQSVNYKICKLKQHGKNTFLGISDDNVNTFVVENMEIKELKRFNTPQVIDAEIHEDYLYYLNTNGCFYCEEDLILENNLSLTNNFSHIL